MTEWHQPPDYIINNWTDELLSLMMTKLVERKQREAQAIHQPGRMPSVARKVSDKELFNLLGSKIKVVKK